MSLVKDIEDKGATLAWAPVSAAGSMVAIGTKDGGGAGFDDYGGELELHKFDFAGGEPALEKTLVGTAKTAGRFRTLAWSAMATKTEEHPLGLLAGGMADGVVNIWDPAKLTAGHPQPQVSTVRRHNGPVGGLQFNPHPDSSHLLASGGADNEVYIMSLERPETPNVFVPAPPPNTAKHTAEVTALAWNSQVAHIVATASGNGSCIVWDLRQKRPWCELRDAARACVADVAWNPLEGLNLVTAMGDDQNPVIRMWDLRSSTTMPLATLSGHSQGVLSVSWCPNDPALLMSCGRDNRCVFSAPPRKPGKQRPPPPHDMRRAGSSRVAQAGKKRPPRSHPTLPPPSLQHHPLGPVLVRGRVRASDRRRGAAGGAVVRRRRQHGRAAVPGGVVADDSGRVGHVLVRPQGAGVVHGRSRREAHQVRCQVARPAVAAAAGRRQLRVRRPAPGLRGLVRPAQEDPAGGEDVRGRGRCCYYC